MLWLAGVMIVLLLRWLLLLLLLLLLLSGQIDKGMISLVDKRGGLAANLGSVLVPSQQAPLTTTAAMGAAPSLITPGVRVFWHLSVTLVTRSLTRSRAAAPRSDLARRRVGHEGRGVVRRASYHAHCVSR